MSLIAGSLIRCGIFMSPQGVLVYTGSLGASIVVWAVCGLLATLGALCFAELSWGLWSPNPGTGEYTYILHTFGSLPAFLDMYTFVLVGPPAAIAAISLSFAEYAVAPFYSGCSSLPQGALKGVTVTCILLLTLVNCWSSQLATALTNVHSHQSVLPAGRWGGVVVLGQGQGHTKCFCLPSTTWRSRPGALSRHPTRACGPSMARTASAMWWRSSRTHRGVHDMALGVGSLSISGFSYCHLS